MGGYAVAHAGAAAGAGTGAGRKFSRRGANDKSGPCRPATGYRIDPPAARFHHAAQPGGTDAASATLRRQGQEGACRKGIRRRRERPERTCLWRRDRKSVVEGKSVDLGGRRVITKKT